MEELFVVYTDGDVYIMDKVAYEQLGEGYSLYKKAYNEEDANRFAEEACYI